MNKKITASVIGLGLLGAGVGGTQLAKDTVVINEVENHRVAIASQCTEKEIRYYAQYKNGVNIGSTSNNCSPEYMKALDGSVEITKKEWDILNPKEEK